MICEMQGEIYTKRPEEHTWTATNVKFWDYINLECVVSTRV